MGGAQVRALLAVGRGKASGRDPGSRHLGYRLKAADEGFKREGHQRERRTVFEGVVAQVNAKNLITILTLYLGRTLNGTSLRNSWPFINVLQSPRTYELTLVLESREGVSR